MTESRPGIDRRRGQSSSTLDGQAGGLPLARCDEYPAAPTSAAGYSSHRASGVVTRPARQAHPLSERLDATTTLRQLLDYLDPMLVAKRLG